MPPSQSWSDTRANFAMRWGITVGILLGGVGCATLGLAYALICAAVAFVFTVVATYRDERRVTDDG